MYHPMWPTTPFGSACNDRVLLGDVLLVLVDVLPVFQHRVRLAVRERLVDRDLCDLCDLHLAAHALEHGLRDVRVGRRACPGLLVERHRAAARFAARAGRACDQDCCCSDGENTDDHSQLAPPHAFLLVVGTQLSLRAPAALRP